MDVNVPTPPPSHHEEESSKSFLLADASSSPRLRPNLINRISSSNNTPERGGTIINSTITTNTKAWSLPTITEDNGFQLNIVDNAHTRSLLFAILFPIAATVTTDVWFDYYLMSSSSSSIALSLDYDVVLLLTNVSGAFIDGFLQAYETGVVLPMGATTEAVRLVAEDFRLYYISTYTSWSGMVNVAATLAIARSTIIGGILYIITSIILAFIAHGFGTDIAKRITSTVRPMANEAYAKPYGRKAARILKNYMLCSVGYVVLPYLFLGSETLDEDPTDVLLDSNGDIINEDVQHKFWIQATPRNQLAISTLFAVAGASVGRALASIILSLSMIHHTLIPMETLLCNGLFGMLGLTLNLMKIYDRSWGDSLLLRGFAISFCGAASLFARHTADNRRLCSEKRGGSRRAVINMAANIVLAMMIFWIGVEIEEWTHPDINHRRRGVVMRIMKILERRKTLQES